MPLIIRIEAIGLEEGDAIAYLRNVVVMTQAAPLPEPPPIDVPIPPAPFITPTLTLS